MTTAEKTAVLAQITGECLVLRQGQFGARTLAVYDAAEKMRKLYKVQVSYWMIRKVLYSAGLRDFSDTSAKVSALTTYYRAADAAGRTTTMGDF